MAPKVLAALLTALLLPTAIAGRALATSPRAATTERALAANGGVYAASEDATTSSPAPTGSPSPAPTPAPGVRSGAGVIVLLILVGSLFLLRSRLDRGRR